MNKNKCITSARATARVIGIDELVTVVLLCDSPGYRMKSYGPPSLITISENRLIDWQIAAIKQAFKNFEIILCVGFDSEKISKYVRNKYKSLNIRMVENQVYNDSNSCESARLALNNTNNDRVLICDGNLWLDQKTLSSMRDDKSYILTEDDPCGNLEVGVNLDKFNEVQHFSFGACKTWSEIILLNNQDIIETFRRIIGLSDYRNKFIFEALNELIKTKHKIFSIENTGSVRKINNVKTYHAITR